MGFLGELHRRHVFRVAGVYLVVAWLIMQVVAVSGPALGLPDWVDSFILLLLVVGLPVAIVLAWAMELTPEGLKRTTSTGEADGAAPKRLAFTDLVIAAAVVVIAGAVAYQTARGPGETTGAEASAVEATPRADLAADAPSVDPLSLAVLPFVNMSSDEEQEYFSDGLSEELLNQLAQIDALTVIGRTSSFAFKGRNEDLRTIGEALGAANLLEGSVRKSGDQLRITAQLIDASSGAHLWSETFDRRLDDVFAIQEEIARSVADALSVTLGVGETSGASDVTDDVEAYDDYLRARALFNAATPPDLLRAADLYREVLARDPDFAPARVGLASTLGWVVIFMPERQADATRETEELAADALARAPDHWSTHYLDALVRSGRHEYAETESALARAEARAPSPLPDDLASLRSVLFLFTGRVGDAVDWIETSWRNDPLSTSRSWFLQQALDNAGRRDEADAEYRRALDLPGRVVEVIHHSALFRVWNGDDAALIEERFDRYLSYETVPTPLFAAVREVYDDADAALALLRAAYEDPLYQNYTAQMLIGIYAGHYGDADLAVAAMRRSIVDMRSTSNLFIWAPDLAAARHLPAFKDLVRDAGFLDYWRETGNWGDFCRPVGDDDFECS